MDNLNITFTTTNAFKDGDFITVRLPRPSWWRLISLWRWWRGPFRGNRAFKISNVTETAFKASHDG